MHRQVGLVKKMDEDEKVGIYLKCMARSCFLDRKRCCMSLNPKSSSRSEHELTDEPSLVVNTKRLRIPANE